MAVLAPQDWHLHRDYHPMDAPSNSVNATVPRQRVSPANDHSPSPSPISPSQGQPYPYPVQQQQAGWNAQAQPFYPVFYQNPHQQQYPMHPGHPQQAQMAQQGPYFDPNAQFAHWAYQQMMFNAQQGHPLPHVPQNQSPLAQGQRGRSASASASGDYFGQTQINAPFNAFPSGTPPAHPSQLPGSYRGAPNAQQQQGQQNYDGFHPYRRPNQRQGSHSVDPSPNGGNEWRPPPGFQPPYARTDAAGSSTSVNSTGSGRQRTSSLQGSNAGGHSNHHHPSNASSAGSVRSRSGHAPPSSNGRSPSAPASPSTGPGATKPHNRTASASSSASSVAARPSPASASSGSSTSVPHAVPRPARPSPLSQGGITAPEKRMSRDDSDLAAMLEPLPNQAMLRSGGLKGRLRRALSLSAAQTMHEEGATAAEARVPSSSAAVSEGLQSNAAEPASDAASTATRQTKKKSRTALFNSRLNASTDNISLSSTMSSASVVIRKLGSIGKLARRNSLAGITSLFKDKKDKDGEEGGGSSSKKGKKKKSEKGEVSEASVSHVTAELDRPSSEWSAELNGLTPAAKLARQHTLKTNAEAAARAKAQEEAAAAAVAAAQRPVEVPQTWEKNTTTRQGDSPAKPVNYRISEEGMRVIVEDDDSASEDGSAHDYSSHLDGWDDEDWSHIEGEEDVTIRQGLERASIGGESDETAEAWAIGLRRSEERTKVPAKGILKNAVNYDQHVFMDVMTSNYNRTRSNSYNTPASQHSELGPLARMPSPDPDHIDGLHRHPSYSSAHSNANGTTLAAPVLPPLPFNSNGDGTESPGQVSDAEDSPRPAPEKTLFNHPNLNSSAPVLSTVVQNPPTLSHRSATVPAKRLAFASNLSVYDTFPATVYDRRSEPATWSRLTPALAQRIKEELNSFKMEEMEVHAASRVHTQFFV